MRSKKSSWGGREQEEILGEDITGTISRRKGILLKEKSYSKKQSCITEKE